MNSDIDDTFRDEVDRAADRGDDDRLAELERMAAEGETGQAALTSDDPDTRLSALAERARDRGNVRFARQIESVRAAEDTAAALDSALSHCTPNQKEQLQAVQDVL